MKKMKIPVGDLVIDSQAKNLVMEILDSGRISEGERVREFEKEFAKFIGVQHCIAVNSGASALITGLTALKYLKQPKFGKKVITTPLTYIADAAAIELCGFEPVFVDVDLNTFSITPENIKRHLEETENPSDYLCVLPVCIMGYPVKIDEILKIANKYNFYVFEDVAQAHGTKYKRKIVGSQADLACFSFYTAHAVVAGEMGAVVTNNDKIAHLCRMIKDQGRKAPSAQVHPEERFYHFLVGYNFKTTEIAAVLALSQLAKFDSIKEKRAANVLYLNERLEKYSSIFKLPFFNNEVCYLAYPVVIKDYEKIKRRFLMEQLESAGIETRPFFPCIPLEQPAFSHLKSRYDGKLPNAADLAKNGFYIGCHQYLTREDLDYVVSCFGRILDNL